MKKNTSFLILILTLFIYPQQAENWKTYSNLTNVNSIKVTGSGIWAACTGGAFFYDFSDNTYTTFNKSDGLSGISLTAVTVDINGKIWLGSSNGIIDVYDPVSKSFISILDIANSDRTLKQINELKANGDSILVSTDFGISIIDANNLVFLDTFFKFGGFPSNIKVKNTLKSGLIYASTESGIAVQKPGVINLSAPESWNVYWINEDISSNSVNKMAHFQGSIIAATGNGIIRFNTRSWETFIPDLSTSSITDLLVQNDSLFILYDNTIALYNNNSLSSIYSASNISRLGYNTTFGLFAAGSSGIISVNDGNTLYPNGPPVNQYPSLAVDNNSHLWSASGDDVTGVGFYEYTGDKWILYNKQNTPELITNAFYSIYAAPDNTIYAGNWGSGFIRIRNNNITSFNASNTDMQGTDENPDFIVVTGFQTDSKGNLWILNSQAVNKKTLSMLTPDSNWYHFTIPSAQNLFLIDHFNLAIDQYDTKWFCSKDAKRSGLYYFNENGTYSDPSDDISGYISESSGLNDNTVNSIVVDRRGDIWVGTGLGVNIISNNNSLLTSDPALRISSVFTLRQQSINCIAVDPINRKWVGTNQGLLLVNSDGTTLLDTYDSKNSALLSNIINSIATDDKSGTIYVGTIYGLTSFETPAIEPEESFSELFMYPSPFILKEGDNRLTIDGLIRDSDIKILSITGKLINEFSSPGGKISHWDGRDINGKLVHSGVYLIVAFDKEGNSTATGKVAVLRE